MSCDFHFVVDVRFFHLYIISVGQRQEGLYVVGPNNDFALEGVVLSLDIADLALQDAFAMVDQRDAVAEFFD